MEDEYVLCVLCVCWPLEKIWRNKVLLPRDMSAFLKAPVESLGAGWLAGSPRIYADFSCGESG